MENNGSVLNIKQLTPYVGCQVRVDRLHEQRLFCGEIAEVFLESGKIWIQFAWIAESGQYPTPESWFVSENRPYPIDPTLYHAKDIGPCAGMGAGQTIMRLTSNSQDETISFYPPGWQELNLAQVEGLLIPA